MDHQRPRLTLALHAPPDLAQERFAAWARLPATDVKHFAARDAAWNLYVDARDGLTDGTTANDSRRRSKDDDDRQPELFDKGLN